MNFNDPTKLYRILIKISKYEENGVLRPVDRDVLQIQVKDLNSFTSKIAAEHEGKKKENWDLYRYFFPTKKKYKHNLNIEYFSDWGSILENYGLNMVQLSKLLNCGYRRPEVQQIKGWRFHINSFTMYGKMNMCFIYAGVFGGYLAYKKMAAETPQVKR